MGMVAEQTKEWTELMTKQRKDNWEMIKGHRTAQEEILKKIMEAAQVLQYFADLQFGPEAISR